MNIMTKVTEEEITKVLDLLDYHRMTIYYRREEPMFSISGGMKCWDEKEVVTMLMQCQRDSQITRLKQKLAINNQKVHNMNTESVRLRQEIKDMEELVHNSQKENT